MSKRGENVFKKRLSSSIYKERETFSYYVGNHQTSIILVYFTILLPFSLIWSPLVLALMRCPRAL